MQTRTVNQEFLTSKECTPEILADIATRHCKMESEQVAKLAKQAKLIGAVRKYLQNPEHGYAEMFKDGTLQLDIAVLPDPTPTANTQGKPRAAVRALSGPYKVGKGNNNKAEAGSQKQRIYAILFECNSFEQFFDKCKAEKLEKIVAQGHKNPQLVFTCAELARWAVKSGWIVPVDNAPQQQSQPAEQQQAAPQ